MNAFGYNDSNLTAAQLIIRDVQSLARLLARHSRQHTQAKTATPPPGTAPDTTPDTARSEPVLNNASNASNAMRQVLGCLGEHGPQSVPRIARKLDVGRQHIQRTVNDLLERDLVTRQPNPDHQRSWIIALTAPGQFMMEAAQTDEQPVARELEDHINTETLESCHAVLLQLKQLLKTPAGAGTRPVTQHVSVSETVIKIEKTVADINVALTEPQPEPEPEPTRSTINWNAGPTGGIGLKV